MRKIRKLDVLCFLFVFVVFASLLIVHEALTEGSGGYKPTAGDPCQIPTCTAPFLFIHIAYASYALLQHFKIKMPYISVVIVCGFIWAMVAYNSPMIYKVTSFATKENACELIIVYTPIILFHMSFRTDIQLFLKSLPQIFIIGLPVSVLNTTIYGLVSLFIINWQWDLRFGILFGIFSTPSSTQCISFILNEHSRTRQINVLLEGEALFSFILADVTYKIFLGYFDRLLQWYQIICVLIRALVVGILIGYFLGYVYRLIIRQVYTDKITTFLICLGVPFLTYTLSEFYISGCGSFSVVVVGAMLGQEKTVWSKDVETLIIDFWHIAGFAMHVLTIFKCTFITVLYIIPAIAWLNYPLLVVTYMLYYILRFFCYLVFSPALSRLGYGMTLSDMIVCVWCSIKTSFGFLITMFFYEQRHALPTEFLFYMMGMLFLSNLVNGTSVMLLLDTIGLRHISKPRQATMNNCLQYIYDKRKRMLQVLKMNKTLTDVDWSLVLDFSNLKHPYQMDLEEEDGGDEEYMGGYRYTWCAECKKNVEQELSKKELADMFLEAQVRVLKAKKMSYSRQYENGMISKDGIKILTQAVDLALDSKQKHIVIADLSKKFSQEGCFRNWVRGHADKIKMHTQKKYRRPKTYWRRLAYNYAIRSSPVAKIMWFIAMLHLAYIFTNFASHLAFLNQHCTLRLSIRITFQVLEGVFNTIFMIEMIAKILGYSYDSVCHQGIPRYFKQVFNVCDFIVIAASIGYCLYHWVFRDTLANNSVLLVFNVIRFLRVVRIFQFYILFYDAILHFLESRVDQQLASAYELAKCYIIGQREVLQNLNHLIYNVEIRQQIKEIIEDHRLEMTKHVGAVHNERPWIAITVKTSETIRTILNNMSLSILQLKASGWIDLEEYKVLANQHQRLYKQVHRIRKVLPSSPAVLFKEINWMANEETVIDFLYENIAVKKFAPGEVVFSEGVVADGIYIVVTGLFKVNYTPNEHILKSLYNYGQLPITDYLTQYEESQEDYIVSGNCIGELSTLTERAYNSVITAEAYSQVYVLSNGVLKRAMEMNSDPVNGLECRIWKEVAIRLAIILLPTLPSYSSHPQEYIKATLERAFSPDLSNYKIFVVSDLIEVVVLVQGIVADYNTKKHYVAPCCIPTNLKKIVLPKSSMMKLPFEIETRLLIVPGKEFDHYDVMIKAEETCELVESRRSSKCLLHTVQLRGQQRRQKRMWDSITMSSSRHRGLGSGGASLISDASAGSTSIDYMASRSEIGSLYFKAETQIKGGRASRKGFHE